MTGNVSHALTDRVTERRRAVALARHFREAEGLSIAQIAERLGRSPATIKAYFYDPSDANKRPTDSPQERQFWARLVMYGRRSASDSSALAATARGQRPGCPICPGAEVSSVVIAVPGTAPNSWKQQRRRGCVTWRLVLTSESHGRLLHCPRRSRSQQHGRADSSLSSGSGPPTWDSRGPPAARSSRGSASLSVQSASLRPSTSGRSRANSQGPCPARLPTLSMSTRRCRRRVGHDEDSLASGAPPLPPLSKCKPLFRRASAPQRSNGAGPRHDPMPIFCTAASA